MDNQGSLFEPVRGVHPGKMIVEYLEFNEWSQRDLARRSGLIPKMISEICNGKAPITPPTAIALEKVFQRPAHFWLNLQRQYDEAEARLRLAAKSSGWEEWAKKFPITEMVRYGWLEPQGSQRAKVDALLRFLGVSSPDSWNAVWEASSVAYRQTRQFTTTVEAISAWVRATEVFATQLEVEVKDFDAAQLTNSLDELRAQTREPAERFEPKIQAICAAAGVAVVWVPELRHTGISGCARWLTDKKALIGLTLRYKWDDQIWFTFFHEIAHILLHNKEHNFILDNATKDLDDKVVDPQMMKNEEEANRFAADTLIPPNEMFDFIARNDFSTDSILGFAEQLHIGPGIVIGRLQQDGLLQYYQGNKLKRKFNWKLSERHARERKRS